VYNGVVYVGVASLEEATAANPAYQCCTFRGSLAAVNAATGSIIWQTYTVPDNGGMPGGYSGAGVWGSTPVVDAARNSVYITTGNNYTIPQSHQACIDRGGKDCNPANNRFDSVIALDISSGAVKWSAGAQDFDAFTTACLVQGHPNCPGRSGPDFDFGSGPNLFSVNDGGQTRQLLGAGQKSGIYWALDPGTGKVVWATQVGPGGLEGGIQWGSAVDGQRVYIAIANAGKKPWTLKNGQTVVGGFWSALDAATGRIVWQTADPTGSIDTGAGTVANGVVYFASADAAGTFRALGAADGRILWNFASGTPNSYAGPAVANGVVYWGAGSVLPAGVNRLYAFTVP
jgi:polyvinyl alcohol dehydrogenase (cytochrome)